MASPACLSRALARTLCAAVLLTSFTAYASEGFDVSPGARVIPDSYIVTFKNGSADDVHSVLQKFGIGADHTFGNALNGFSGKLSSGQLEKLRNDNRIASIEPDVEVHAFGVLERVRGNAIDWNQFFAPKAPSQSLPTGILRIDAEMSSGAKINGTDERVDIDVAVIDTGVQKTHPDLNVFKQVKYSTESSVDDKNGHGTHVAGTIGALDNTVGVVGVAPGARIWSVKVLGANGSGRMSDIIAGVDYVRQNAASIEVANMSLGCECVSAALNTAITNAVNAGVTFVVAAGNSAKNSTTFSPANHPDVITVSAIADFNGLPGGGAASTCYSDIDDTFANFSNFGAAVDIAAPGVCINSTWKGSAYKSISGTSMASPHVAGGAALWIAKNGKPTNAAGVSSVKSGLIGSAWSQAGANGFTGDPDGFAEPVLNAGGL